MRRIQIMLELEYLHALCFAKSVLLSAQGKQNGAASNLSAAGLLVAVGFASGSVRATLAATARHAWSAQNCNEG